MSKYLPELVNDYMQMEDAVLDPDDLSVGCEFEFVLAVYRGPKKKAATSNDHGKIVVHQALSKPLSVKCAQPNCKEKHTFQLPLCQLAVNDYDKWQVALDDSVMMPYNELRALGGHASDYDFYPMEVKTRKFSVREALKTIEGGHLPEINFQQEITTVLDTLNERFKLLRDKKCNPPGHIFVTRNCGFHVHVGNGDLPIPLSITKKIYSIFIACERQMDGLHGANRITGTTLASAPINLSEPQWMTPRDWRHLIDSEVYNRPLSHYFITAACIRRKRTIHTPRRDDEEGWRICEKLADTYPGTAFKKNEDLRRVQFGRDIDSWLALVPHAAKARQLRELHALDDWKSTINVAHLPSPGTPPTEAGNKRLTIEFRQHAGILNSTAALSFIDVVISLVTRCNSLSKDEFSSLIKPDGKLRDPEFSTFDFLEFVGCSQQTNVHYNRLLTSHSNDFSTYLKGLTDEALEAVALEFPIGKLAHELVKWQSENTSTKIVKEKILNKLLIGGYGHFSEEHLQVLLPKAISKEERETLVIGYKVPIVGVKPALFKAGPEPGSIIDPLFAAAKDVEIRGRHYGKAKVSPSPSPAPRQHNLPERRSSSLSSTDASGSGNKAKKATK